MDLTVLGINYQNLNSDILLFDFSVFLIALEKLGLFLSIK